MSESRAKFNEYILNKYPNRSPKILLQLKRINHSDYVYEVHEVQDLWELWSYQQTKINNSEAALKEALAWVEDLKRERGFLQKKCAERADRIDAVKAIMNDYYTGSYDESAEMAGLISAALDGEHE